ncbi:sulfite exporter TauE/SafE family protein [Nesterenkonia lutea]|uniref:Probable membrane transporter protein n=1 Tax=Nesterenkonia lutea TaxID=272919 RepID=A0ABR9JC75_9MICC|nr:sulfite exporter TauE/SafE family protein [Nesterenkonia lutea]MBE1523518.1 putative membrane protein YfcA [Nesterenkonia lutea]
MTVLGMTAVIAAAVLLGTILQRVSGTGVGLVVAPVLSILLGPAFGVLVTNMTTFVSGCLIMIAVWSQVSWRHYWLIMPASVLGAIPGAWVVGQLSAGWLSIIVGAIVVFALLVTVALPRLPHLTGRGAGILAGMLGGFFNTASGVAAPVMVIYSRLSRWDQRSFAATLQPIFMTMGAVSVITKLLMGSVDVNGQAGPPLSWLFPIIVATVILGILLGTQLAKRVSVAATRTLAMALAGLGGTGAIIRGALEVLG